MSAADKSSASTAGEKSESSKAGSTSTAGEKSKSPNIPKNSVKKNQHRPPYKAPQTSHEVNDKAVREKLRQLERFWLQFRDPPVDQPPKQV